jgi:hypothetical protein
MLHIYPTNEILENPQEWWHSKVEGDASNVEQIFKALDTVCSKLVGMVHGALIFNVAINDFILSYLVSHKILINRPLCTIMKWTLKRFLCTLEIYMRSKIGKITIFETHTMEHLKACIEFNKVERFWFFHWVSIYLRYSFDNYFDFRNVYLVLWGS